MFAIIATGGKQLNVEVGKEYFVEKLDGKAKDKIIFDQVLMVEGKIGSPLIKGAQVHAKIVEQDKEKKIVVFKYKPKKNSKTKYGHRQPYTKVVITDILLDVKPTATKAKTTEVKDNVTKKATSAKEGAKVTKAKATATKAKSASKPKTTVVDDKGVKAIYDHEKLTVKFVDPKKESKTPKK